MASPREIASAFVRLFVKKDKLKADLDASKQEVRAAAQEMQGSADRAGRSFEDTGRKIQDSTRGVRAFSGAISATVGVWTSMLGVVTAIAAALALFTAPLRKAREEAQAITTALEGVDAAARTGAAALTEISKAQRGIAKTAAEAGIKQLLPQLFEGTEAADKIRARVAYLKEQIERGTGGGVEKILELRRQEQLLDKAEQSLRRLRAVINRLQKEEERETEEAEDKKEKAALSRIERVKRAELDAVEEVRRAQEAAQASLNAAIQGGLGGLSVDSRILAGLLEEIRDTLRQ